MTQHTPAPISPRLASELLHRMRHDYHDREFFDDCCEEDPTIQNRLQMLVPFLPNGDSNLEDQADESEQAQNPAPAQPATLPAHYKVWDYRSDLLALYILGQLMPNNNSANLQADMAEVSGRIEIFGNRNRKVKKVSAPKLLADEQKKVLVAFGTKVADALLLFQKDPSASQRTMDELKAEIVDTENVHNEQNMWRIRRIAKDNYFRLRKKYTR